ncbi:BTB/POZ domain-containing protein kctd6 [Sorochytrium milnesiophthora]
MANIVTLNVGGKLFATTLSTLRSKPDSFLGVMFSERNMSLLHAQPDGSYFIDRSPDYFGFILDYYRDGVIPLSLSQDSALTAALRRECAFFNIPFHRATCAYVVSALSAEEDVCTTDTASCTAPPPTISSSSGGEDAVSPSSAVTRQYPADAFTSSLVDLRAAFTSLQLSGCHELTTFIEPVTTALRMLVQRCESVHRALVQYVPVRSAIFDLESDGCPDPRGCLDVSTTTGFVDALGVHRSIVALGNDRLYSFLKMRTTDEVNALLASLIPAMASYSSNGEDRLSRWIGRITYQSDNAVVFCPHRPITGRIRGPYYPVITITL